MLPPQFNVTPTINFEHYLQDYRDPTAAGASGRDESSEQYFWVIRLLSAYEGQDDEDNDGDIPDGMNVFMGYAPLVGNNTTYIFYEVVRDFRDELASTRGDIVDLSTALDRTAAHEALHRFFGGHGTLVADEGIMQGATAGYTANDFVLTGLQIRALQRLKFPK